MCVLLGTGGDANSSMSSHGSVGHLGIPPPITTAKQNKKKNKTKKRKKEMEAKSKIR